MKLSEGGMASATRRDEMGDTLLELLIAIVIIAVVASALLGALITGISASTDHRSLAVEETILKSSAEDMKNQIEQQGKFVECATSANYAGYLPTSATTGFSLPTIQSVQYWNGSSFDPSCGASDMTGVQQITLIVSTNPVRVSQTLSFIVRNSNYVPSE